MSVQHRLKELGVLDSDVFLPEKLTSIQSNVLAEAVNFIEEINESRPYQYTANIGDWVIYKEKEYVIIDFWFNCGGNARIICMVRINTFDSRGPFTAVKNLADEKINECELIRRGVVV